MMIVGEGIYVRIKFKSIVVNNEVLDKYGMPPFTSRFVIGIPIKLILGIFVLLHFIVGAFYPSDNDLFYELVDNLPIIIKVFAWIFKAFMYIIGYGLGIILIPIQIITVPFVLLYLYLSNEKDFYYRF